MQVVPSGIESVNGSDVTMGCTSPLVDDGGVRVCPSDTSISYLFDGCSPDIDTSASDWASQLVTVRNNGQTDTIPFNHVLLTFGLDTAVSLTGFELDLFLCPEWKIGAPGILVYAEQNTSLHFNSSSKSIEPIAHNVPNQTSCNSLSTVTVSLEGGASSAFTWHFVVTIFKEDVEWVHVGYSGVLTCNIKSIL